jgi:hypothetical protein
MRQQVGNLSFRAAFGVAKTLEAPELEGFDPHGASERSQA